MGILNRLNDPTEGGGIVLATVEDVLNWGRSKSDWYLQFGLACCAIEFMAVNAAHYDLMRYGIIFRSSPRQADFLFVTGTITLKMAERVKRLYEQLAEPKYVIAVGSCAASGGPYWEHGYHVLKGLDQIIPVDVYIPGCPPRPEAFQEGMMKLQAMINQEAIFNKRKRVAEEDAKFKNSNFAESPSDIQIKM